jgi:nucleoid DNA-binding protein
MNKAKVIDQMAKMTKLPKSTVKECLEAFIGTIGSALKLGKPVALTGFGTFSVFKRQARSGINPATGKKMTIPAKKVPKFKAGKALKSMVK